MTLGALSLCSQGCSTLLPSHGSVSIELCQALTSPVMSRLHAQKLLLAERLSLRLVGVCPRSWFSRESPSDEPTVLVGEGPIKDISDWARCGVQNERRYARDNIATTVATPRDAA